MTVHFHEEDLPAGVLAPGPVAIDTETMGLVTPRDRLCVVQIADGQGDEHLVRFAVGSSYANLTIIIAKQIITMARTVHPAGNYALASIKILG